MNYFKILLGVATLAIISFNIVKNITEGLIPKEKKVYVDSEILLSEETNSSLVFSWQSQESEIGSVEYGIIQNTYYQSESEFDPTHMHKIKLISLKPCTKYYYQVTSESMLFDIDKGSFTTLCGNARMTYE